MCTSWLISQQTYGKRLILGARDFPVCMCMCVCACVCLWALVRACVYFCPSAWFDGLSSCLAALGFGSQEYLKLSDVYKMYGNGCHDTQIASSAQNCTPLAVVPALLSEVPWLSLSLPFSLSPSLTAVSFAVGTEWASLRDMMNYIMM